VGSQQRRETQIFRIMRKAVASNQPGFAKYMVLMWNGREQVLVFPFGVKHAQVLEYIQAENPDVVQ
jgi:hypothetical protein